VAAISPAIWHLLVDRDIISVRKVAYSFRSVGDPLICRFTELNHRHALLGHAANGGDRRRQCPRGMCLSHAQVKERRQDIKVGVTPVLGDGP
jgi:hypothetical protein